MSEIMGEICRIEDEMAELAEDGNVNALAAWCISCLSVDASGDGAAQAQLLALKAIAPSVTLAPVARAARELLAVVAASEEDDDGQRWRGKRFDWLCS